MSAKRSVRARGYLILLAGVPLAILLGIILFQGRRYNLISLLVATLSLAAFFLAFERRDTVIRELVVIAVLTALSVIGRVAFVLIPSFKPVTAMVIISAVYFGSEAGFMVGALSALISNMFYGQGTWTPFQMFAWGLIGLIAGLPLMRSWLRRLPALLAYGVLSGVAYSLIMDIFTVTSFQGDAFLSRYLAAVALSLPVTAVYCVSNVVFLLIAAGPIGRKLERIRRKIGLEDMEEGDHT